MGKCKIPTAYIEDNYTRRVCFNKRFKGLLRKAIELSIICNYDLGIVIADKTKEEVIAYKNTPDLTNLHHYLDVTKFPYSNKMYCNEDYDELHYNASATKRIV